MSPNKSAGFPQPKPEIHTRVCHSRLKSLKGSPLLVISETIRMTQEQYFSNSEM